MARHFILLLALGLAAPTAIGAHEVDPWTDRDQEIERLFLDLVGTTHGFSEDEEWELAGTIYDAADAEALDPYLVLSVIRVESSFIRGQRSNAGALGLMQVKPSTAVAFADRAGVEWNGPATLFDPHANVRIGTAYLGHLHQRFGGRRVVALTSYNHGPTRVARLLSEHRWLDADRLRYSKKVMRWFRKYQRGLPTGAVPLG